MLRLILVREPRIEGRRLHHERLAKLGRLIGVDLHVLQRIASASGKAS